ncbi:hypothetical protein L9F63_021970, partial [Diploptera punctata]
SKPFNTTERNSDANDVLGLPQPSRPSGFHSKTHFVSRSSSIRWTSTPVGAIHCLITAYSLHNRFKPRTCHFNIFQNDH